MHWKTLHVFGNTLHNSCIFPNIFCYNLKRENKKRKKCLAGCYAITKFQQNLLGGYGIKANYLKTVFLAKIFVISVSCICVASDFSDFYRLLTDPE